MFSSAAAEPCPLGDTESQDGLQHAYSASRSNAPSLGLQQHDHAVRQRGGACNLPTRRCDWERSWITSVFDYGDGYGVDDEKLQVGGWGDSYHSLLQFDLAGLPDGAVSATLVLAPFSRGDASTAVPMEPYRPITNWDETTGWPTRPQAEFVSTLPAPVGGRPYSIDVTTLYNAWKSGALPDHGLELRPTATDNRFNVFRSSDYQAEPVLRPKLQIVPSGSNSADRFTWPTDPLNTSAGEFATCGADNPLCFWLDPPNGWRDVQPFLKYPYTSPRTGNVVYHLGADWNRGIDPADSGATVFAAADGDVARVVSDVPGFGRMIFIQHRTSFGNFVSVYGHVDWLPSGAPAPGPVRRGAPLPRWGMALAAASPIFITCISRLGLEPTLIPAVAMLSARQAPLRRVKSTPICSSPPIAERS